MDPKLMIRHKENHLIKSIASEVVSHVMGFSNKFVYFVSL